MPKIISQIIGYTKVHGGLFKNVNHDEVLVPHVDTTPDRRVKYPPIKSYTPCELLIDVADSQVKVADGVGWSSTNMVLNFKTIKKGCVKFSVDDVVNVLKTLKVYNVTMADELERVE